MNHKSETFAQLEYHQGVGVNYIKIKELGNLEAYGFTYNSRLNLLSDYNYSIGLSAYPSISVARQFNTFTGSEFILVLDAPILMNLNVGTDATFKNRKKFGYTIGFGYQILQHNSFRISSSLIKPFSFIALLGIRIRIFDRPLEVNAAYALTNKVLGIRMVFIMAKY